MGETEDHTNPEMGQIRPTECLVIIGHGIEKVGEKWQPTRYIQKLDVRGFRTGLRQKGINSEDENVIIGGGVAETLAAAYFIDTLQKNNHPLRLIIFAAGRPSYLDEQAPDSPEITEGRVMDQYLNRKVEVVDETDRVFLDQNRNTQDDIERSLQTAQQRRINNLAFLTIEIRQARCRALLEQTLKGHPEYSNLKIDFAVAEDILKLRFHSHPQALDKIVQQLQHSRAYQTMEQREQEGITALKKGNYTKRDIYKGNY